MVRAIVGTLLDVGTGKSSLTDFQAILNSKDRTKAGSSAPAQGLFLTQVQYPNTIFETNG
jgi:tRNA pseudouridine38-40 synthase